jgi:hypothetical protein
LLNNKLNNKGRETLEFFNKLLKDYISIDLIKSFKNIEVYNGIIDDISQLQIDLPHFNDINSNNLDNMISLKDLFSDLYQDNYRINPLFFSASFLKVISKNQKIKYDGIKIAKNLTNKDINWQNDWDNILSDIYNIKFNQLDDNIKMILDDRFNLDSFLVIISLSYLNLKRELAVLFNVSKEVKEDLSKDSIIFNVSRIYWL